MCVCVRVFFRCVWPWLNLKTNARASFCVSCRNSNLTIVTITRCQPVTTIEVWFILFAIRDAPRPPTMYGKT